DQLAGTPAGRQDDPQGRSCRHHRLLHQPRRERQARGEETHSQGRVAQEHADPPRSVENGGVRGRGMGRRRVAWRAALHPTNCRDNMASYPIVKVCAAHVAPVFLDAQATVAKATALIAEAAAAGAKFIAFPESFVPGFPVWASVQAPIKNHDLFKKLAANSIEVPGPETSILRTAARKHQIYV